MPVSAGKPAASVGTAAHIFLSYASAEAVGAFNQLHNIVKGDFFGRESKLVAAACALIAFYNSRSGKLTQYLKGKSLYERPLLRYA